MTKSKTQIWKLPFSDVFCHIHVHLKIIRICIPVINLWKDSCRLMYRVSEKRRPFSIKNITDLQSDDKIVKIIVKCLIFIFKQSGVFYGKPFSMKYYTEEAKSIKLPIILVNFQIHYCKIANSKGTRYLR